MTTSSTSNNSTSVNDVVCTPTFVFPAFSGLDARQTLSNFVTQVPVSGNQQNQQRVIKFTKTQGKNGQRNQDHHQTQAQLISTTITSNAQALTNALTITSSSLQQQQQQQFHQAHQLSNTMIITNSSQIKNNHLNSNSQVIWSCPSCKVPFKTASELQTHLSVHTKTEKSVPCEQCGKLFASAERVRIHVKVAHGAKSSKCDVCGSLFSYKCKLADHMRTHTGDKPFQCDVCGRKFSQKNHVRRHKMIHTGEKPFPCDICGRGFYRKDKLTRHRLIHTNPSSRKNKQSTTTPLTATSNSSTSLNVNNLTNLTTSTSLNTITNGNLNLSNDLINTNSTNLSTTNSSFLTQNNENNNLNFSNTSSSQHFVTNSDVTTIQLIPVQLAAAQQWIASQTNVNTTSTEQQNEILANSNDNNSNLVNVTCT